MNYSDFIHVFTALFVIVNPFGAIPLFISYTQSHNERERIRTVQSASIAVAAVLIVNIFLGDQILRLFGIGLPSFRVGGGVLLMLTAVAMLNAKPFSARSTPEELDEIEHKENIAVVPLAIPMLAGPGAISTVIVYSHRAQTAWDFSILVAAVLLVTVCVAVALLLGEPIAKRLGSTGINIATRLMSLLLAAVSVEFIAGGILQLLTAKPPG